MAFSSSSTMYCCTPSHSTDLLPHHHYPSTSPSLPLSSILRSITVSRCLSAASLKSLPSLTALANGLNIRFLWFHRDMLVIVLLVVMSVLPHCIVDCDVFLKFYLPPCIVGCDVYFTSLYCWSWCLFYLILSLAVMCFTSLYCWLWCVLSHCIVGCDVFYLIVSWIVMSVSPHCIVDCDVCFTSWYCWLWCVLPRCIVDRDVCFTLLYRGLWRLFYLIVSWIVMSGLPHSAYRPLFNETCLW